MYPDKGLDRKSPHVTRRRKSEDNEVWRGVHVFNEGELKIFK